MILCLQNGNIPFVDAYTTYVTANAGVAELADAPDLGSGVPDVQVQVLSPALLISLIIKKKSFIRKTSFLFHYSILFNASTGSITSNDLSVILFTTNANTIAIKVAYR